MKPVSKNRRHRRSRHTHVLLLKVCNGEVSYTVTNLDSALTMLMAVYVYEEKAVKDTKQIALENTTGGAEHLSMGRRCAAVLEAQGEHIHY
ncbi:hypothetical protein ElyMa_005538900 [Elysia marginata]|uniref:Uncharacterized protein n=1 Tax=Elysia marginata TaxID=1093978 RepID=A0AAV4EZ31_9GAST|nr:hypothetical protein ElyMa_005538900 [Elysia marginata]